MRFKTRAGLVLVLALFGVLACGGDQKQAESPESSEGAAERAGKDLDEAAKDIHEKGDEVGKDVDETFREAGKDVKEELGDDPHAPPPKVEEKK